MRPFEVLFLIAALAGLAAAALPVPRGRAPIVLAAAVALLALGVVHGVTEGVRWQMVPAYVAALLLLCALTLAGRGGRLAPRMLVGLAVPALAVSAGLGWAFPVFRLPPPDGPHAVGTVTYHWIDPRRDDPFTPDPADRREVMVQVWYPAVPSKGPRARYVPDAAALAPLPRLLGLPGFFMSHLDLVRTNAVERAPAAPGGRWPVLIFSHGRAGYRQHNTWQAEALASHGYVVAAIDHAHAAAGVLFPDGRLVPFDPRWTDPAFKDRMVPALADDVSFVATQLARTDAGDPRGRLTGRLDLQRLGLFGVSLGGAVAATACQRDPRLKACLAMDVYVPDEVARQGPRRPFMWISRDAAWMRREGWADGDVVQTQETMRGAYERSADAAYIVLVPGTFHPNFSDAPFLTAAPVGRALGLIGPADPGAAGAAVEAYTRAFFDRHLQGRAAPAPDGSSAEFPGVVVLSRRGGA